MTAGRLRRSLLVAVVWLVAACGPTPSSATPPSATTPIATPSAASGVPEATPPPSGTPAASAMTGGLVVDPALLEILPTTVDGVAMEADPATAETLLAEAALSASASGIAIGRYVGAADQSGQDIAVASIVQLRPGVFSEPFFATWRDDYDRSACESAGGDTGVETEVAIGSFPVHLGTCAGGATTYHVHLDGDILVSILAVGPSSFGDLVVAGLRP